MSAVRCTVTGARQGILDNVEHTFGMTRMCVGATGAMSRNARHFSSAHGPNRVQIDDGKCEDKGKGH